MTADEHRCMSPDQRACVAADVADRFAVEAKQRQDEGRRRGGRGKKRNSEGNLPLKFRAAEQAAATVGAGQKSTKRARAVRKKAPELLQ